MASHITVARPYAKALFEFASQHKQVDAWLSVLSILSITLGQASLQQWLKNPMQSQQDLVELVLDVVSETAQAEKKVLGESLKNFLLLLAEAKRLSIMPDISRAFHLYHAEQTGVVEADVVASQQLTNEQRTQLQEKLEKRLNTKVELSFNEDSTLMGGLVVTTGNWVMDGSIQSKIARLNEVLTT